MELRNEQAEVMKEIVESWYKSAGYVLQSDEYFMDSELENLKELEYSIPEGIEVVPMSEITNDALKEIVFETFRASGDEWVGSMTDSQLEGSIEEWLKRDETFLPDASIVLMKSDEIIGYNVMRFEDESVEVGPVGVLQSYRGNGFGQALILESTKRLTVDQQGSVWLTVSTGNTAAFNLYCRLGFVKRYPILIYQWTP